VHQAPTSPDRTAPSTVPPFVADLESTATRHETPCGDGTMVWRSWGSGPPVVLLHGSHGSWLHWVRNIPVLAATRQVWVPDLPGYGESAPPADINSADSHAEALAAGLRTVLPDAGPVDVVAFSLGALIGAHLAVRAPALVRRMVLVDTGGIGTPTVTVQFRTLRGLEGEALQAAHRTNLERMMFHHPDRVDDLALWINATTTPQATSRVHYQMLPDRLLLALRRTPVQLDAIWGEFDCPHPDPEVNVEVVRSVDPGAELRTVHGAGHWSIYEGADEFNRHVLDLLDTPLRAAASR
jgi:2-hydroxy-6-oxonona-2,4-dienedioate hydrolase